MNPLVMCEHLCTNTFTVTTKVLSCCLSCLIWQTVMISLCVPSLIYKQERHIHSHIYICGQSGVSSLPKTAFAPHLTVGNQNTWRILHWHRENMQTFQRRASAGPSCCDAPVLSTVHTISTNTFIIFKEASVC